MTEISSQDRREALEVLAHLQSAKEELSSTRTLYEQHFYGFGGSGVYQLRAGVTVTLVLLALAGVSFAAYTWLVAVLPPRSALGATVVFVACAACTLALILQVRFTRRQSYRARLKNELELSRGIERQLDFVQEWLERTLRSEENTSESSYVK